MVNTDTIEEIEYKTTDHGEIDSIYLRFVSGTEHEIKKEEKMFLAYVNLYNSLSKKQARSDFGMNTMKRKIKTDIMED